MSKLSITIVSIGPEEAQALLVGHSNYRQLSKRRTAAYARLMLAGQWKLSIIILNADSELVDGATRLNAVIQSGVTVTFAVVEGWPEESVIALDNGQSRTRQQVAHAERGIKDGNKVMATVVGIENPHGGVVVLNAEALSLYDKYGHLAEEVLGQLKRPLKSAVHAIPFARACIKRPDRKGAILDALHKLSEMDFIEPRMSGLRLYFSWAITRGFAAGGGARRWEAYLRCARALSAYLDNETLDKLYCPKDDPFEID